MELAINGGEPASSSFIGYGHQAISEEDIQEVAECLRSDYLTCGPATTAFEDALKEATGAAFATAVANGTAALHVACLAAGIRPGSLCRPSPLPPQLIAFATVEVFRYSRTSIRGHGMFPLQALRRKLPRRRGRLLPLTLVEFM